MTSSKIEEMKKHSEDEAKYYFEMVIGRMLSRKDKRMLLTISKEFSDNKKIKDTLPRLGKNFYEDIMIQAIDMQYGREE